MKTINILTLSVLSQICLAAETWVITVNTDKIARDPTIIEKANVVISDNKLTGEFSTDGLPMKFEFTYDSTGQGLLELSNKNNKSIGKGAITQKLQNGRIKKVLATMDSDGGIRHIIAITLLE